MKYPILLFLLFKLCSPLFSQNELDSLLVELEKTMSERGDYDNAKEQKIQSIKNLLFDPQIKPEEIYDINKRIINEYEYYIFDTALFYIEKNFEIAKKVNNPTFLNESNLILSGMLASSGRYKEAIDILNKIDKSKLSKESIITYFNNYESVYSNLNFYTLVRDNEDQYKKLHAAYTDSLEQVLAPNSERYLDIQEKKFRDSRQMLDCRKINSKRMAGTEIGSRNYSLITFHRSLIYELENNREMQKNFLILSAISDIKASVKDNASLTKLAMMLYEEKDIERAYTYIKFSFEDAVLFNSRLRFIEISNILSVITHAYQLRSDAQHAKIRNSLIVISILSVGLLLTIFFIYRQMKNLSKARNELGIANHSLRELNTNLSATNDKLNNLYLELKETNHVKEQYIGNFLSICSNYIDKLDVYRKMVKKMIVARKFSELLDQAKSNQFIDKELNEFYENFDNTFLSIYPNFVDELNALLMEDELITLKKGELLNTELRIFALIRLGISDSSKIASLLRYSVNTIYNYRVKIKNKSAVPRDDFEEHVLKIGAFSK